MKIHFAIALLVFAPLSPAQDDQPPAFKGPALRATGVGQPPEEYRGSPRGRLMAERAAQVEAVRNLALAVGTYLEIPDGDERTRTIEAFISGFVVTRKEERADGSFEVEVALPYERVAASFRGILAEAEKTRAELEAARREAEQKAAELEAIRREIDRLRAMLEEAAGKLEEAARQMRQR